MKIHPLQKYVRVPGYGDDNFLHEYSPYEEFLYYPGRRERGGRQYPQKPLDQIASKFRKQRLIAGRSDGLGDYLFYISEEIERRSKIIKQEFYKIGELLCLTRKLLKEHKKELNISFQEWVNTNFDFSYTTALNLCNVYLVCTGNIQDVRYINLSVLYKICSKNFPKILREYLLTDDNLSSLSLNTLNSLCDTYKKASNGIEEFENEIEKILKIQLDLEEYAISMYKIDEAITQLTSTLNSIDFKNRMKHYTDSKADQLLGDMIINFIHNNLFKCLDILMKQKEYLLLYYNNLPKQEPKFSKYYQFNPFDFTIEYSTKVDKIVFNRRKNIILIPKYE